MAFDDSSVAPEFEQLKALRSRLLQLHKALLDAEKDAYEQTHGPVRNRGEYFQLVVGHEWFSWLRPMSQFIVEMDEVLMAKEPQPVEAAQQLLQDARVLIKTSETGQILNQRYEALVQLDPHITPLYQQTTALLNP